MKVEFNGLNINFGNFIEKDTDDKKEKSKESDDESERRLVQDWTKHLLYPFMTCPDESADLLPRLIKAVNTQEKKRTKLLYVRSYVESGNFNQLLPRQTYVDVFGDVSKSCYSEWMGATLHFTPQELDAALATIKNIKLD